jgi:integrase
MVSCYQSKIRKRVLDITTDTSTMSLTDAKVRAEKPKEAPLKISDGGGLYVLIQPSGSKLWRMGYRVAGRQKTLAFGIYPDVSLADARARRDEARLKLRQGVDPSIVVKAEKLAVAATTANTFRAVAADWFQKKMVKEGKSPSTLKKSRWVQGILNDGIGDRAINEIEAPELLVVLRRVEAQGKYATVKRLRSTASAIFRFGIATGACKRDPSADLRGALTSVAPTPHAAVTDPADVGKLLRAIDGFERLPTVRLALKFLALTFVRPGELCSAEWSEITGSVWDIPGPKMKMRLPHRVPLSRQALAVLDELRPITGKRKHLFASSVKPSQPFTTNLLNSTMHEIGFDHDQHVPHGFRSTASTILNESGEFSPDVIELSLAHIPTGVRGIYNRSKYWPERVALAQWYADHLDELRGRGKVVSLPRKKARKASAY